MKGREKGGGGGGEGGGGGGGSNYEVRDAIGYRLCAAAAVGRRGGRVGVFLSLLAASQAPCWPRGVSVALVVAQC